MAMPDMRAEAGLPTTFPRSGPTAAGRRRLSIAIVAMGGQGGGVLSDWLVAVAEAGGWRVQSTSVPGVAQRTGATVYYVEMFAPAGASVAVENGGDAAGLSVDHQRDAHEPVLALMPGSGDVDLVIAAEWMEAGRAIVRGLVTPDRTTLVASTHRSYATVEKMVPGNGMADARVVHEAARMAAQRLIAFDMAALASAHRTVISAPLLGAVAASGVLPFALEAFEAAIRAGGVGVEKSVKGFLSAYEQVRKDFPASPDAAPGVMASAGDVLLPLSGDTPRPSSDQVAPTGESAQAGHRALPAGDLGRRIGELPLAAQAFAHEGARRCVDYLDADYARAYLDRLAVLARHHDDGHLLRETARWLALRMCYEDPIRVADLKTRRTRFAAINDEVRPEAGQLMHHTEFMHPRLEEVIDTLPVRWADRIRHTAWLSRIVGRAVSRGLLFRTSTLRGFLLVWGLARCSRWRRQSLRFAREQAHIDDWLRHVDNAAQADPGLGVAVAGIARVIKGYGDTHARSLALHAQLCGCADALRPRADGAQTLISLIDAALADAQGTALAQLLQRHGLASAALAPSSPTTYRSVQRNAA